MEVIANVFRSRVIWLFNGWILPNAGKIRVFPGKRPQQSKSWKKNTPMMTLPHVESRLLKLFTSKSVQSIRAERMAQKGKIILIRFATPIMSPTRVVCGGATLITLDRLVYRHAWSHSPRQNWNQSVHHCDCDKGLKFPILSQHGPCVFFIILTMVTFCRVAGLSSSSLQQAAAFALPQSPPGCRRTFPSYPWYCPLCWSFNKKSSTDNKMNYSGIEKELEYYL